MTMQGEMCIPQWHIRDLMRAMTLLCIFTQVHPGQSQVISNATAQLATAEIHLDEALRTDRPVTLNLGRLYPDEPIVMLVEINNDTQAEVRFLSAESDCGCATGDLPPDSLAPGTSTALLIRLDMVGNHEGRRMTALLYELSVGNDESDRSSLTLVASFELRRDVFLSDREVTILLPPMDANPGQPFRSNSTSILLGDPNLSEHAHEISVQPLEDLPPGLEIVLTDLGNDVSPSIAFEIDPAHVSSQTRVLWVPLLINVIDQQGRSLGAARRGLNVRVQSDVQLRTTPDDLFLGILTSQSFPLRRSFTLSLDPPVPFGVEQSSGSTGEMTWQIDPVTDSGERSEQWILNLTIEESPGIGTRFCRLPISITHRDSLGGWQQVFNLTFQYISVQ